MYTLIRVNDGRMPSPVNVLRMGIPMIASALQRAVTEADAKQDGKTFATICTELHLFQQLPVNGLKRITQAHFMIHSYLYFTSAAIKYHLNGRPLCGNSTVGGDLGPRTSNLARGELVHAGIIGAVHEIVYIRCQTIYRGRVHGKYSRIGSAPPPAQVSRPAGQP